MKYLPSALDNGDISVFISANISEVVYMSSLFLLSRLAELMRGKHKPK